MNTSNRRTRPNSRHGHAALFRAFLILALLMGAYPTGISPVIAQTPTPAVNILAPDGGGILYGNVTLQANVIDTAASSVEFFYRAHEDATPTALGPAAFDPISGYWTLTWDTTTVQDTYNIIDTDGDGVEDTPVNITKPPTHDELSVAAVTDVGTLTDAIDVRIQNMLTVRLTLPDNQEDMRGFADLEAVITSQYDITSVRFDVYSMVDADPAIITPFGEFQSLGEPIENRQYGRPLGSPAYPTGSPVFAIGTATPEGARRWVFRGWDTTTIPDGTWLVVATAEDSGGRRATYMIETYIVNDLRVQITAPDDGATVSRFVALEARTSSLTGADNAAPGSLWPATSVVFDVGGTLIAAVETPSGSGRWRAVWNGDMFAPGPYTITATATNANPNGQETAVDSINVNLVALGTDLAAHFPFDWSNCTLYACSFLDGSGGGPTSWLWDFGDGNTSTNQLPTHTYANYGVYTVSLTVSNDGGVTTDSYTRLIPVGNIDVVSFNRNALDDGGTQFVDWTSAFKNFNYTIGDTLAIPVMWETTVGSASFASLPTAICDDDETTSNQECVIFTPEEAFGTPPVLVGAAEDGALFTMQFTEVQYRGITEIFKGKANIRVVIDVDLDGDNVIDQQNQLGTNVDVTNTGAGGDENRIVRITYPAEGQFVGGIVGVSAGIVSSVAADQVEFFVNGTSLGVDANSGDGWSAPWNTTSYADGPYQLTAVARFGTLEVTSAVRNVSVNNAVPEEPDPPAGTFQTGRVSDTTGTYISFPHEVEEEEEDNGGGGGGRPAREPSFIAAMSAEISNIVVYVGGVDGNAGVIGGDAIEFDVTLTNTSTDPGAVMTAFAFQSKFSESPALASRIGDKAFYGVLVAGGEDGRMSSVKKNGTSNGLFGGRWKGICINSSIDYLPEFNAGLDEESLECGGNRADLNADGLPELQIPVIGIYPGDSQTVRVRIEAGTTDGALHVVEPGTLRGQVVGTPIVGPNGITYFVPSIDNTGVIDPNVLAIPDFADNKVLRDADGTFNPTFAPMADGLTFANQIYLTLPRRAFSFSDILGRNHTCATYGLDHIHGISCNLGGDPNASPVFGALGIGDLLPGVQNFAAMLHGFGEYAIDENGDPILDADGNYTAPMFPYDTLCVNPAVPDGLRCGAKPYTPVAEFYKLNEDGTLTQQMVAGSYGELGSAEQYTAVFDTSAAEDWKEESIPEEDPGAPPTGPQLSTSAVGHFYDLDVFPGAGINGGDVVEFTVDITNNSLNPNAYLTAFNYQTKQRSLADIGVLDGYSQDRRDIRVDPTLPLCNSLVDDGACYNAAIGIGQFPNVIGNGLLFGQMVWQSGNTDRSGQSIIPDFVAVNERGVDPVQYKLESVKKNGPFTPILKGNVNFICIKSGLFAPDQDSDASCAGDPAILIDESGNLIPANISQRLGLAPGETQSVRIRQEFGDFRGAMLEIVAGTLTSDNVNALYGPAGTNTDGLARQFDCEDQRELEYCHPHLVGENINYLPNTDANWMTPENLEDIEYVIINQPGDAPRIMNFQENFGYILAMAGFIPSAEFYAPDPNPALVGTPDEGILIQQQVLGEYVMTDVPALAPIILSSPVTDGSTGMAYTYDANATAFPGPIVYSLDIAPSGMAIDGGTGVISWTPSTSGVYGVTVRATNGTPQDAVQTFQVTVTSPYLDDFNRPNGSLGSSWAGVGLSGYRIVNHQVDVISGGPIYWRTGFGASQQAAVTLTAIDSRGQHGLLLKADRQRLASSAIGVIYLPRLQRILIETKVPGHLPRTVGNFRITLSAGDRLGAQALADGTVVVTVNGDPIGTADAGSFFANRGGHVGLWYILAGSAWLDDFSGGDFSP